MNLWRIEVREANLDPPIGVIGLTDAKAVAVAHIPNGARELDARLCWEAAFARIGVSWGGHAESKKRGPGHNRGAQDHAASCMVALVFFFFSIARTNLSHFAMPARFSTM